MIHVVLYRPEIALNVGNIMRTCSAIGAKLHIIGPLPFEMSDASIARAGMDYIKNLDYYYYETYEDFASKHGDKDIYYVTRYGTRPHSNFDFSKHLQDYYLMFGRESTGIPKEVLAAHLDKCVRIPMKPFARSLNLANSVAIVAYEAVRQQDYQGLSTSDNLKEEDLLKEYQK